MKIFKFGGTSVGSPEALRSLAEIVRTREQELRHGAVVVSALSGVTNQLIGMARLAEAGKGSWKSEFENLKERHRITLSDLFPENRRSAVWGELEVLFRELEEVARGISLLQECSDRSMDLVMSFGERLSARLVSELLQDRGLKIRLLDTREVILTDRKFGSARVQYKQTYQQIQAWFGSDPTLAVATGFIGRTDRGETSTLGRGGSDFTAAILAGGLGAEEILIYTDVNGMLTADPRVVPQAFTIPLISYQEAMELSHFGAKVIYPPTLQPAFDQNIPIRILNTFQPEHPGTLISQLRDSSPYAITGLSAIRDIRLFNVQGSGLVGVAGFASRLFSALGRSAVNVILITQASSEHSISFAVSESEATAAQAVLETEFHSELAQGLVDPIESESDVSILAIVGDNMRNTPGVSGKVFQTLGRNKVNIRATAQGSSELNISIVIPTRDLAKSLKAIHQAFFLSDTRKLHVFLVGPGLIGKAFLRQVSQQAAFLRENLNLEIVLVGIANSRKMLWSEEGISKDFALDRLEERGQATDLSAICQTLFEVNLPDSVLVDCTSGAEVIPFYESLLARNIAVVTPNKIANSGSMAFYNQLRNAAMKGNTRFLYETNVGAGLPIIQTLKNLIHSGDRIDRIEAMLSGTLSFIFNSFHSGVSFRSVVEEAKELGYTEPDPRDDLSGKDMARKILILARESGLSMEPEEVETQNILPRACLEANGVSAFLESLDAEDAYFRQLALSAEKEGKKLKFICKLESGKVAIRLEAIGPAHPFWNSSGADNILAFYTARYTQRPMVIQGPGAGAEVTAAGVFGDLISLA